MCNSYIFINDLVLIIIFQYKRNSCSLVLIFLTIWQSYTFFLFCVSFFVSTMFLAFLENCRVLNNVWQKFLVHCPEILYCLPTVHHIYARQTRDQATKSKNLKLKPSQVKRKNTILDSRRPSNKQFKSLECSYIPD